MATATTLPTDTRELEAELKRELQLFETVQGKLDSDKRKLQEARDKRAHTVALIPRGEASESDVLKIEAEIRKLEILIEGNTPILERHRARIAELRTEIQRRQDAVAKAARERAFLERSARGEELALKIRAALTKLCVEDYRELMELCRSLAEQFMELGGHEAALRVLEILFSAPAPNEALRNPECHIAALQANGWEAFGYEVKDRPALHGGPRVAPGPPLRLSVVPMRPQQ